LELYFPVFRENNIVLMEKTLILLVFLCCGSKRFGIQYYFIVSLVYRLLRVASLSRVLIAKLKFAYLLKSSLILLGPETLLFCSEGPAICLNTLRLNPILSVTRYILKMRLNLFLGPKFISSE
jgi:hypothetical protein